MGWLPQFLAALAFLAIGVIFSPETKSPPLSTFLKLAHLLSFFTWFGTELGVHSIGALIMFFGLPRHQFGNLRSKMFPAYFVLVGICCAVSVASFGYLHSWSSSSVEDKYQLGVLISSLAFNLSNLFVFTPMTIEVMKQRHKIEREEKIGDEYGSFRWSNNVKLKQVSPEVAAMKKKFGTYHRLAAGTSIMLFCSLSMHTCYLVRKLDL